MIVNNYTGTLRENKETQLSFTSLAAPVILIREFEFNLIKGDTHLVIPYYVSDYSRKDYVNEKLCHTFTTIVTVDEDTVPKNEVKSWKKTTYAGEQSIDLGTFDSLGLHTLNIRTIQSNGVGSATTLLKFFVRNPIEQRSIIDLSSGGSFTSEWNGHKKYISGASNNVLEFEYNCSYEVSCTLENDNVTDIQIVVSRTNINKPCITCTDMTSGNSASNYNNDCDEVYHVATSCVVSGVRKLLTDYLNVQMLDLPRVVIETAAKNKFALTRLFEAARAAGADTLKLPLMNIVCDYHYPYSYGSTQQSLALDDDIPNNGREASPLFIRNCITIPNGLCVDLNKSSVFVLKSIYNNLGRLFSLRYCTDAHLINGTVTGNWLGSTPGYSSEGEHRSVLQMRGSQFCSFENLTIRGTTGYDIIMSAGAATWFADDHSAIPSYDKTGYIDYDGEERGGESIYGGSLSDYYGLMHESSGISLYDTAWFLDDHVVRFGNGQDNSGNIAVIHTLTNRTIFASFYDEGGKFIKTVKTSERVPTLIPYGATTVKLCKYGTSRFGDIDSVNVNASKGRYGCSYRDVVGWGNGIYGCDIHTTRQVAFANGTAQSIMKDCRLYGLNCERNSDYNTDKYDIPNSRYTGVFYNSSDADPKYGLDNYSIYATLIVDIEDESRQSYHCFWDNVELVYGTVNTVKIDAGTGWHFKNCHNLDIRLGGECIDSLIENCSVSVGISYSWLLRDSCIMVRNSIIDAIENGFEGVSRRGAASGNIYVKNNMIVLYGAYGRLNSRINKRQSIKM